MTTKFSCHSLCDEIVVRLLSCADIHNIDVTLFLCWYVFVRSYA